MVTAREFGHRLRATANTVGQATRDPDQLRFERETAKMDGVGQQTITQRYNSQQEKDAHRKPDAGQIDGPIF